MRCFATEFSLPDGSKWFRHFTQSPKVVSCLVGEPAEAFVEVDVESDPGGPYFAWDDGKGLHFMNYAWLLVDVCFPYGSRAEELAGRGKVVRARVTRVQPAKSDERT